MERATLYSKPGCHLCEDALGEIQRSNPRALSALAVVDVTGDPALFKRYGHRIPVLRVGEREYDAPLDRATIRRALGSVGLA